MIMANQAKRVPLEGSHRLSVRGSRRLGPVHPDQHIEVTVRLRPRTEISAQVRSDVTNPHSHKTRRYLTHDEFTANHGASDEDIAKIAEFAHAHGLAPVQSSPARRSVWLAGSVAKLSKAFGVELAECDHPDGGTYRERTGPIMIPQELAGIVVGVFGLDNRPQAKPHFRLRQPRSASRAADPAAVGNSQFTPIEVAKLYDFPPNLDGTGQCIGIIELGGGFNTSDLTTYFTSLGVNPVPTVTSVSVDHGSNTPSGGASGPDGEVMLDIEVAGAVAPNARIVVYFTPNTSQGFLDAITQAVHDTVNQPSVISISWGGPEAGWTAQAIQQFDQAFQAAAALGITICVAAGDNGSSDGDDDGLAHVDFPASSPNALACGGTRLNATDSAIISEVVWNEPGNGATGGGVSDSFPLPSYQENAGVPPSSNPNANVGRGVPDVAADADPFTGYSVRVDGQNTLVGGTSAVAPLWAGLVARLNQALGKPVGFLNPTLYALNTGSGAFRDITSGNNGAYSAGPGWDACTGLGVAVGQKLLSSLSS
jgi:kumamolisin